MSHEAQHLASNNPILLMDLIGRRPQDKARRRGTEGRGMSLD